MIRKFFMMGLAITLLFVASALAQVGSTFPNVSLLDVNSNPTSMPKIGEKVLLIYYVDPDVYENHFPVANEVLRKGFASKDYQNIAIMNLKETWVPNFLIISECKKSQKKNPTSQILLDKKNIFSKALKVNVPNNSILIAVVGTDSKIKLLEIIKSKQDAQRIASKVTATMSSLIK